jgi:hypothetical protein
MYSVNAWAELRLHSVKLNSLLMVLVRLGVALLRSF